MAPILDEMERQVKEVVAVVGVKFLSYVDDLHCRLYELERICRNVTDEERRECMSNLVDRASLVVKESAGNRASLSLFIRKRG